MSAEASPVFFYPWGSEKSFPLSRVRSRSWRLIDELGIVKGVDLVAGLAVVTDIAIIEAQGKVGDLAQSKAETKLKALAKLMILA